MAAVKSSKAKLWVISFSMKGTIDATKSENNFFYWWFNYELWLDVKLSIFSYRKWKVKVIRTLDLRTKDMCSNPALVVHTEPSSQPLYNP